jgi:hypothetical protein
MLAKQLPPDVEPVPQQQTLMWCQTEDSRLSDVDLQQNTTGGDSGIGTNNRFLRYQD